MPIKMLVRTFLLAVLVAGSFARHARMNRPRGPQAGRYGQAFLSASILIPKGASRVGAPGPQPDARANGLQRRDSRPPEAGGPNGPPVIRGVLELLPELDRDGARLRGDDVRLGIGRRNRLYEARELGTPIGHIGHDELDRHSIQLRTAHQINQAVGRLRTDDPSLVHAKRGCGLGLINPRGLREWLPTRHF